MTVCGLELSPCPRVCVICGWWEEFRHARQSRSTHQLEQYAQATDRASECQAINNCARSYEGLKENLQDFQLYGQTAVWRALPFLLAFSSKINHSATSFSALFPSCDSIRMSVRRFNVLQTSCEPVRQYSDRSLGNVSPTAMRSTIAQSRVLCKRSIPRNLLRWRMCVGDSFPNWFKKFAAGKILRGVSTLKSTILILTDKNSSGTASNSRIKGCTNCWIPPRNRLYFFGTDGVSMWKRVDQRSKYLPVDTNGADRA